MGINTRTRRAILGAREWHKRGMFLFFMRGLEMPAVEIPKRQNKYLKEKEVVEIKRMKKKGLLWFGRSSNSKNIIFKLFFYFSS
jgi:hypothetical protein